MDALIDISRKLFDGIGNQILLLSIVLTLSACGGGSSSPTPSTEGPSNSSPVASAGSDRTIKEQSFVILNGSGTDPDPGTTLTFSWSQVGGPVVTIVNSDQSQAGFSAPIVAAGSPPSMNTVNLSGNVQYEFVPATQGCNGLDYSIIEARPIRQATVQVFGESTSENLVFQLTVSDGDGGTSSDTVSFNVQALLESAVSDNNGNYLMVVPSQTDVAVRVRAELKNSNVPTWDVEIRDNTLNTSTPLDSRPLFVLDGSVFNVGDVDVSRNLTATTGWGGAGYSGARASAPFAILDAIYSAMSVVIAQDPSAVFPALDVFWSVNNRSVQGTGTFDENIASGEIGTSFYSGNRLFLLGMEDDDTEEFDDHVVVHEWGHYFEDNFSRSDSIGGAHGLGQSLDMRLAFGEGFATALSGIGLNDPIYCDTVGAGQGSRGVGIDIENENATPIGFDGWYNEVSVLELIYDLWDTNNDGADNDSMGFGPIYDVMTGTQAVTPAFTSMFSFAAELKAQNPVQAGFVNTLLGDHNIVGAGADIYGSTETNDRGGAVDVLPVYTTIVPDGVSTINICSNDQFDGNFDGNKLSTHRYLRMTVTNPSPLTFSVITTTLMPNPDDPMDVHDQSDPDIMYFLNGQVENRVVDGRLQGLSGDANQEIFTTPNVVAAGDYVITLHEFRYEDDMSPANYPSQTCFDVTIGP